MSNGLYEEIKALEMRMFDLVVTAHKTTDINTVNNYIIRLEVLDNQYKEVVMGSYVNWKAIDKLKQKLEKESNGNR